MIKARGTGAMGVILSAEKLFTAFLSSVQSRSADVTTAAAERSCNLVTLKGDYRKTLTVDVQDKR